MMRFTKLFLPLLPLLIFMLGNAFIYAGSEETGTSIAIILKEIVFCAVALLLYRFLFVRELSIDDYTVRLPGARALLGGLCILPSYILIGDFLSYFVFHWELPAEVIPMEEDFTVPFLYMLESSLIAPTLEEICFRMMMVTPYNSKKGKAYAVIVSSVLFGLLHNGGMERRLGCVLGGFFFAAILLVSKNLLASIMAHGAVNGLYIVARFIGVKCPKLFFVWPCGRLLGATWPVWAACILLCAVGVWLLLSQKRRATQPEPDDSGVIDT